MKRLIIYLSITIILLLVWQYFGSTNNTVRLYISSPSLVLEYIGQNYQGLIKATGITLIQAVAGLLISITISFIMMFVYFIKPRFLYYVLPIMIISQVIPVIVLAPFFIILLGIGMVSKIAMAAVISFFPVFISFVQGYKAISKNTHELMQIYGANLKFKILNVYIPLSMPSIMAGLKISATLAVIGSIVTEFTGAKYGIGKNLFISSVRLNPDLMMSSLLLASLIGLSLYGLIAGIEKKYGAWYIKI